MWNPPIALTSEEQHIATRTRKTRKFFVCLREHRQERLDADLQPILAQSSRPEPGGHEPVDAGRLALATLVPAYGHVGDRDAVALTVMDTRWQLVLACLGAEPPPCSQGPLCHCRRRLMAHHLDQTRLERTVAVAEHTGGCGARPRRAVLDSTPLCGAGRVEDPVHLLGHALRTAVGLAAPGLGPSAAAVVEDAGRTLVGHRRLTAALALDGGEPRARERARGLGLEEVARWPHGLEPPPPLAAQPPPLQEGMETITQLRTHDTEPDPAGGPSGRRLKTHVAPDRRSSSEAHAMRHGRQSRAKTFHGCTAHWAVEVDSTVIHEGVVRPANAPEPEAVELRAAALENAPGLLQRASALGDMASPRLAQGAEPGVYMIARPWPPGGPRCTQAEGTVDCAARQVPCPGGQSVPRVPGPHAQFPATACDACAVRAPGTTATPGPGRSVGIPPEAPCQQQLRAKMRTRRGRAALRTRTAVEHTMAHPWVHQGRRARSTGVRKHQFDGRRHAAVSNLQGAAHYEEHRLVS
jgi:Transposase DDE domain